jgi:gliding motility-associated lipoprotein GldK
MKKVNVFLFAMLVIALAACNSNNGELTGVPGRKQWFHPQPNGTVYVPTGSIHIGSNEQDVPMAMLAPNKQISVSAFYMDETEITNNEYRQFVYAIVDSFMRTKLEYVNEVEDVFGNTYQALDYTKRIDKNADMSVLQDMYYNEAESYYRQKQLDVRKLIYRYNYIDLKAAAALKRQDAYNHSRSEFKKEKTVKIYPDTLVFIRDFTYSYNEPLSQVYFWHPKYDEYPVVGVSWHQARAFCHWRTSLLNSFYDEVDEPTVTEFRLPTEFEWEYAARGGRDQNLYPWGNYYVKTAKGCSLANYKPGRGEYDSDGGHYPIRVSSYFPNDFGLFDMSGNVSEWTSTAYENNSNLFSHDNNPDFQFEVAEDDPDYSETLKRKIIRGGSWKDVAYYLQCGTKAYEYQDSCNSYTGFRCVMSYIGRSNKDKK